MSVRYCVVLLCLLGVAGGSGCRRSPKETQARFMERGKKRMEARDYTRAALEFQNAVRTDPKAAEPHYQLATAYLALQRPQEGVRELVRATTLNSKHAAAQLKLAELMVTSRDENIVHQAEEKAQQLLTEHPGDSDALFVLAAAQVRLGKPEEAEKYLQDSLQKSPQNLRSSLALAQMKMAAKDLAGAEQVLVKAMEQAPKSTEALVALGVFFAATGKPAEAEAHFRKAVQLDTKNGPALLQLAGLQMRQEKKQEAEQTYRQLSDLPQKEFRPALGIFYMRENKLDSAISEFQRQFKRDPKDRAARSRLVAAYLAAKRASDAENVLRDVLKQNAKDVEALLQRARIYVMGGKFAEAQGDLTAILQSRPDSAEAHYLLAGVHKAHRAALQQRQELTEALRYDPQLLEARVELCRSLIAAGDAKTALDLANATPEGQKESLDVITVRNWALISAGDVAGARKEVDRVLAKVKTPDILLQDAVIKMGAKDYSGARVSLEEILKVNPADLRALGALAGSFAAQKQAAAGTEKLRQYAGKSTRSAEVQLFFANWLLQTGQRAEARTALGAAKAASTTPGAADLLLAQLDLADGKPDAARQGASAVLAADSRNIGARMLLGDLEEKAGNTAKAVEQYRKVLDVDQANTMALNNLAYCLSRDSARLDEALQYAQKAREQAPDNSATADTLGWVYYKKGLYSLARPQLESAVAQAGRPALKLHLGMTCLRLGEVKRGRQLVTTALSADPSLPDAAEAIKVMGEAR